MYILSDNALLEMAVWFCSGQIPCPDAARQTSLCIIEIHKNLTQHILAIDPLHTPI